MDDKLPFDGKDNGGNDSANPTSKKKKKGGKTKVQRDLFATIILGVLATCVLVVTALNGLWHEIWVKWILIPVSLAVASFGIYEFFSLKSKLSKARSGIIGLVSFLLIGGGVILAYVLNPERDFSINVLTSWTDTKPAPWLWYWSDKNGKKTAVPVRFFLYLQFVNQGNVSYMINDYYIEFQTSSNSWKPIVSIDIRDGGLFAILAEKHQTNKMYPLNGVFDTVIDNKTISPQETVQGWIFLDMPQGTWSSKNARFHIVESNGKETFQEFDTGKGTQHRQPTAMKVGEDVTNFSQLFGK